MRVCVRGMGLKGGDFIHHVHFNLHNGVMVLKLDGS